MAASQPAGARVVARALRRIGVEGPTLTQDAREASAAVRPSQQTHVCGHAVGLRFRPVNDADYEYED
jgi:hypothetical protein